MSEPTKNQPPALNAAQRAQLAYLGMARNELNLRTQLLNRLLDPRRNIDAECGYPLRLTVQDFKNAFDRDDLAARVVKLYPEETWSHVPEVFETDDEEYTEFEKAWEKLVKTMPVFSLLSRVDILSGIGRFGLLLIGLDDGKALDQPVDGVTGTSDVSEIKGADKRKLLYLRAFDETVVSIEEYEKDITNPRYGLPTMYNIKFVDSSHTSGMTGTDATRTTKDVKVHWTRVLHVADNRGNSEVFGTPRLQQVFNRILDLKKVAGGSAEMFWKGGFPGLSIESAIDPDKVSIEFDAEATKEQMEAYMNGLQRYIATVGMTVKNLGTQVADPRPHVEIQVRMIAMAMSVPWRILMGVEVGHLAAEQDIRAWNRRLLRRREDYINPYLVVPFINRMIEYGVLPSPEEYHIEWPDLHTLSDEDKATVAEKKTNALIKYVQGAVDVVMPPYHYLTLVLGLSDEEAQSVIEAAGDTLKKLEDGSLMRPGNQPDQSAIKGANQPPRRGPLPPGVAASRNGE